VRGHWSEQKFSFCFFSGELGVIQVNN
jgi:hypothetical protein